MNVKKTKTEEDVDFEIRFLEGVLKESPDFEEALGILGHRYTQKGLYKEGLDIDKRLSVLKPFDPVVFYNLSCSLSLLKNIPEALKSLEQAISLGYDDFNYLMNDRDLANLRNDEKFQAFMKNIKK